MTLSLSHRVHVITFVTVAHGLGIFVFPFRYTYICARIVSCQDTRGITLYNCALLKALHLKFRIGRIEKGGSNNAINPG